MKYIARATVAALALATAVGSASAADNSAVPNNKSSKMSTTQPMAKDSLSLTTSQQKQVWNGIEGLATKQNAPPSFTASVGTTVPSGITLSTIPAKVADGLPKLRPYDYALVANKLLIVNPRDKTIVDVISGSV